MRVSSGTTLPTVRTVRASDPRSAGAVCTPARRIPSGGQLDRRHAGDGAAGVGLLVGVHRHVVHAHRVLRRHRRRDRRVHRVAVDSAIRVRAGADSSSPRARAPSAVGAETRRHVPLDLRRPSPRASSRTSSSARPADPRSPRGASGRRRPAPWSAPSSPRSAPAACRRSGSRPGRSEMYVGCIGQWYFCPAPCSAAPQPTSETAAIRITTATTATAATRTLITRLIAHLRCRPPRRRAPRAAPAPPPRPRNGRPRGRPARSARPATP